jgi:hypothetical protein
MKTRDNTAARLQQTPAIPRTAKELVANRIDDLLPGAREGRDRHVGRNDIATDDLGAGAVIQCNAAIRDIAAAHLDILNPGVLWNAASIEPTQAVSADHDRGIASCWVERIDLKVAQPRNILVRSIVDIVVRPNAMRRVTIPRCDLRERHVRRVCHMHQGAIGLRKILAP